MECHFYFEVLAPEGLIGIGDELEKAELGLSIYHSNFNNKNILRSDSDLIELGMDTSTTDVMYGSGFISSDFATAIALMRRLSSVFTSANYSHKIGIDNETGTDAVWITHNYS